MRKRYLLSLIFILAAASIILTGIRCQSDHDASTGTEKEEGSLAENKWLNLGDSATYVGMDQCRKCHEDIYQSFKQTGMGQSFDSATRQKSVGNFHNINPIHDKYSGFYYLPYWQGNNLMVKEYRLAGRDTTYKRIEKIDYIIGSGHHTNSHIQNINGYLNQAPFTYYVQKGKLDLPPGFEGGFNSRFSRELGLECLSCHNAYPGFVKGSFNKYTRVPNGIDCERCHGPGSIHVRDKSLGKLVDITKGPDYSIVNPRKLPYELQIDVCQRCHLQGNAVLKDGKSFFDFRPGMKLSDVMDVFLPVYQNQEQGFMMASHAERLQKSPCFLQSNAGGKNGLNCITCHNPHLSVRMTKQEYFLNKCQGCHPGVHKNDQKLLQSKNGNCISCHMPKTGTVDIPHVTITDHYIRVVKNKPENNVIGVGEFKGLTCVNNSRADQLTRAKAFMYFYEKFERKAYNLDSAWKYLSKFPVQPQAAQYIYYYYLKDDFPAVVRTARQAGSLFAEAVTNYQVAQSLINTGNPSAALPYMQSAVKQQPYNLDYRLKLATVFILMRNLPEAEKEYNFVVTENPKQSEGWNGLAFASLARQDAAKARQFLDKALALDPDAEAIRINEAKYYILLNDLSTARKKLEAIIKRNPRSSDARQLLDLLKSGGY